MNNLVLCLIVASLVVFGGQAKIAHAQQQAIVTITEMQINAVVENQGLANQLKVVNIPDTPNSLYAAVLKNQYLINFYI